jgi:hypothetical protein
MEAIMANDLNVTALAISGGTLAAYLIEALIEKGVLTRREARAVIQKSLARVTPLLQSINAGPEAATVLTDLLRQFPEDGK